MLLAWSHLPLGWIVALFLENVAFASIESAFPQARPAYDEKIHAMVRTRGGPVYALLPAFWAHGKYDQAQNWDRLTNFRSLLTSYGFVLDASSCELYKAYIGDGIHPYQWCRVTSMKR